MSPNPKKAKIIVHLPPPQQIPQFLRWAGEFSGDFMSESSVSFREGMQNVIDFVAENYPAANSSLSSDLIVYEEPIFNAYLDTSPGTYYDSTGDKGRRMNSEICVNIGIPITLACLKPVLFFAAQSTLTKDETSIPTEIFVCITHLFIAWHQGTYPPTFVSSLSKDPALHATQTFLVAHEASHFLFRADENIRKEYNEISIRILEQLLSNPGFFTSPQIEQTKRIFADKKIHASWVEELSADLMAHNICKSACEQRGRRDLFGITTICAVQAILEHYLELENIQFTPTHPYASARLLAFERHLQNQSGLSTTDFRETLDWAIPMNFFSEICRILQQIHEITWSDEKRKQNTYAAKFKKIMFKKKEYLLFDGGEIGTVESVENLEFPYAHLFENGNIMRLGKKIGTKADIQFLGEGKMLVDVDSQKVKWLKI